MGEASGLSGQQLSDFVNSGGGMGSTAFGGGGVGTGSSLPGALQSLGDGVNVSRAHFRRGPECGGRGTDARTSRRGPAD